MSMTVNMEVSTMTKKMRKGKKLNNQTSHRINLTIQIIEVANDQVRIRADELNIKLNNIQDNLNLQIHNINTINFNKKLIYLIY